MEAGEISLLSRLGNNLPNLDSNPKRTILVAMLVLLWLAERTPGGGGKKGVWFNPTKNDAVLCLFF
jgi:hypothetical protein